MKAVKKSLAVLLALIFAVSTAFCVSAAGSVTYNGNSQKFIFAPGSEQSKTDLFENFKNVMPGDVLTDTVVVKNPTSNGVKVNVYLKYSGADSKSSDLLSKVKLTVNAENGNELYASTLDKAGTLADWVSLGTVYSGGEVKLNLKLEVPAELGNELQDDTSYVNWQFKVEELPVEQDDPQPPQTNDTFNIVTYSIIGALSLIVIATVLIVLVKKKKEQ